MPAEAKTDTAADVATNGWLQGLRTLASDVMARAGLALRAGKQFNGNRDLFEILGYKRELQPQDYRDRFERNGIAAAIVEAYPTDTWEAGAELIENEDPEVETEFEKAWDSLDMRLHIWAQFKKVDILAGLGEYAVLLIGAPGELTTPLPPSLKPDDIMYLKAYAQDDAKITKYEENNADERFGQPTEYELRRTKTAFGSRQQTEAKKVHYTRVIHVVDGALDDEVHGTPRLKKVWNDLDDLEKVKGGGAEAFWLRAHQGLHFDLDKDVPVEPKEMTAIQTQAEEYQMGLRRILGTRGMKLNVLGSDTANFSAPVDGILTIIAGATGIPKRILTGAEQGELASSQDRNSWDKRISQRRSEYAEPVIVKAFVTRLQEHKALPKVEEYVVRWPEFEQNDDAVLMDMATKAAALNKQSGGTVILPEEIRDRYLRLEPLTPEQIAAEEQRKQEAMLAQQEAMGGADPFTEPTSDFQKPEDVFPKAAAARNPWLRLVG